MKKIKIKSEKKIEVHDIFFKENIYHDENPAEKVGWSIIGALEMPTNTKRDTARLSVWHLRDGCCETIQDVIEVLYYLNYFISPVSGGGVIPTEYFEDDGKIVIRDFTPPWLGGNRKYAGWENVLPALNAASPGHQIILEMPKWEKFSKKFFPTGSAYQWEIDEFFAESKKLGLRRIKATKNYPIETLRSLEKLRKAKDEAGENSSKPKGGMKVLVCSQKGRDGRLVGRMWTTKGAGMFLFPISEKFTSANEYWWAEVTSVAPNATSGKIKLLEKI